MSTNDTLLSPINIGGLELSNRVVMAPMTRNQSLRTSLPTLTLSTTESVRREVLASS